MQHQRLGGTGLAVSRVALGTMTFGGQADEATSHAILDRAIDAGITLLDTANSYPSLRGADDVGRSEEIIGRWMKGRRDEVLIATKCFAATGPLPFQRGLSRKAIFSAIEGSLRRLGTDHIDLYQLHHPDPETPMDETLQALDDLVRAGRIRYVGCSNLMAYQVARALGRSDVRRLVRFVSVQSRHNLLFREFERELLPLCIEEDIGFLAWSPLAGGMLSGKHDRTADACEATRFGLGGPVGEVSRNRYWIDETFDLVARLMTLADAAGLPLSVMALAWSMATPGVTAPIVGATRPEQLDAAVAAVDVSLGADLMAELDAVTRHRRWGEHER